VAGSSSIAHPVGDGADGGDGEHGRCWGERGVSALRVFHGSAYPQPQLVTVAPVDAAKVEVGDIVLARVAGTVCLHLVSAIDAGAGRVQISNNRGRLNGWANHARVYGICTSVDGASRPRIEETAGPVSAQSHSRAVSCTVSRRFHSVHSFGR
jgi:hypothetical protein